jgi:DNA-binding GntR family transcriptional regulator
LKPGERLVEERICKMFKVGRTPLREALRQLQMEGCVDVLPNKGAMVSRISVQDVEDIYSMIAILEGFAVEIAAKNIQSNDMKILSNLQNNLKMAARRSDYRKWIEKNSLFHSFFPRLSGNRYLSEMVESLRKRVYRYRFIAITIPNHMEDYISSHEKILGAITRGESKAAGTAMKGHVLYVREIVSKFLRNSRL